jgi:hypothetical protein
MAHVVSANNDLRQEPRHSSPTYSTGTAEYENGELTDFDNMSANELTIMLDEIKNERLAT